VVVLLEVLLDLVVLQPQTPEVAAEAVSVVVLVDPVSFSSHIILHN
jgi:hypothetical protein